MRRMIDKLEMFIALAKERHFGRAAEVCGVTQPSLSSAIRQLEDQLGVQLVFRGSRFQGLTPEGQRVLDWARRIVGDMRALKDEMRAVRSGLSGNLRLGVIPTALPMVADLTAPFTRAASECAGVDPVAHLASRSWPGSKAWSWMRGSPIWTTSRWAGWRRCRFIPNSTACSARRARRWPTRRQVTWAEVAEQPLCLLTSDMQNRRIVNQHLAEAGAAAAPQVEIEFDHRADRACADRALGQRRADEAGAACSLAGGRLRAIPIVEPEAEHLVGPDRRAARPADAGAGRPCWPRRRGWAVR